MSKNHREDRPAPRSGVKSAEEMGLHRQPPPKMPPFDPEPEPKDEAPPVLDRPSTEPVPPHMELRNYPLTGMSWGQAQQAMKDGYTLVRASRIHGPLHQGDIDAHDWMVVPPDAPF